MSNHPTIAALRAALESERNEIKDYHACLTGDCSHEIQPDCYFAIIDHAHEAATERLMTIIESLVSCLERYESLKSYPSMSVDRFGNKFVSVNDLGKDARKVLSTLAGAGVIKKDLGDGK